MRISRKLAVVITVHLLHATVLLALTYYGVKAVDASRAWVDGEGFWSKAQKESVVQLLDYARSGDASRYQAALAQINVTLGDRQARLELEKPSPDLAVVRAGFIQANNHPSDVGNMIWLFQTFRHEYYIDHAIFIWTHAEDDGIQPLRAQAAQLHAELSSAHPDLGAVNATVGEILATNAFLEGLEHEFSTTLGDGARFINAAVVTGTVAITVLFVGSALLVSATVARGIARSLDRVKVGAEEMAAGRVGLEIEVEGTDDVAQVSVAFNTMSRQLAKTIREREEQAAALTAALESTTDGLLVVDGQGRFVQCNMKFRTAWLGRAEGEVETHVLSAVEAWLSHPGPFAAKVAGVHAEPESDSFDVLTRRDGREFEAYSRPQRIEGKTVGRVWSFRDVTDRRLAEEEQRRMLSQAEENKRLRELDVMKSDFINSTAHELRTPLTPLRAEMHVLRSRLSELDPKTQRSVYMLDRNLDRLGSLVEQVLEGSLMQAGQLGVKKVPVDLARLLLDAVEAFQSAAVERGVRLESDIRSASVEGDAARLSQVVNNLINNALRFTPRGGVIRATVDTEPSGVTVKIQDSGLGIPKEKQARLFRPFSQLHDEPGLRSTGTGLGLYICKGIIDLHGGTIGCHSEGEGRGSTFFFTLPTAGGQGS
ncbi:MAG: sensor histidine kinase [Thermoplasmatota archaeon]